MSANADFERLFFRRLITAIRLMCVISITGGAMLGIVIGLVWERGPAAIAGFIFGGAALAIAIGMLLWWRRVTREMFPDAPKDTRTEEERLGASLCRDVGKVNTMTISFTVKGWEEFNRAAVRLNVSQLGAARIALHLLDHHSMRGVK